MLHMTSVYKTRSDIAHWFLPRKDVIHSYIIVKDGIITDFISFYIEPSHNVNDKDKSIVKSACSFHKSSIDTSPERRKELMFTALILAKNQDCDDFQILDIMNDQLEEGGVLSDWVS